MSGLGNICSCNCGCPDDCNFKNAILDDRASMSIEVTVTEAGAAQSTWPNGVYTLDYYNWAGLTTNDVSYWRDPGNASRHISTRTCGSSVVATPVSVLIANSPTSSLFVDQAANKHLKCSSWISDLIGMYKNAEAGTTKFRAEITDVTFS